MSTELKSIPSLPALLRYGEAASYLRISPATLRTWVMCKRIPFFRLGKHGRVLFDPEDLRAFVLRSRVEPMDPVLEADHE